MGNLVAKADNAVECILMLVNKNTFNFSSPIGVERSKQLQDFFRVRISETRCIHFHKSLQRRRTNSARMFQNDLG